MKRRSFSPARDSYSAVLTLASCSKRSCVKVRPDRATSVHALKPRKLIFFFLYINMWQYLEKNSCWPLMQMTLTNSSQAQPRPLIRRVRFPLWLNGNSLIHSPSQHEAYKLVNSLNLIYLTWSISLCPRILPASKQPYVTALQLFIVPVILMPLSVRTDISFNKGPY